MKQIALLIGTALLSYTALASDINWPEFLSRHDLVWDRVPTRWELAPFSGNGMVGFLFYQDQDAPKNVIRLHVGRHDYYDHRLPYEGNQLLWIYRSRLPLGYFDLESKGDISGADLRLDLWNAELTGTIKTSRGSYVVRGLSHATKDIVYFETEPRGGESIKITWHPEEPMPPVRATLDRGGGPKGGTWDRMRKAPMPMPPKPTWSREGSMQFCSQPLYQHRGETTTGWEITGEPDAKQVLIASVHHSFPEHDSLARVRRNLLKARELLKNGTFISTHRQWWHAYYPLSFLSFSDPEKEGFYWIQMYKLGSAMRQNGPILDLMGPWYHKTFWPMVWGDLNVELIYWTHLTANRMAVGESLPNNMDKYAGNLANNVPEHWADSASVAALMPQDLDAHAGAKVPDMLAWMLHDYWLHCEYAGDRERLRKKFFPLLRKVGNAYLNYLKENPVEAADGKIHIRNSWSPEYPGGHGQDINFTIALMRWSFQTLLDLNAEFDLNDPLASQWRNVVENLVPFQTDENGLRIGKDIPFEKPHRHYSHLLGFYPLALITPDKPADARLLRTSVDHWLDVSIKGGARQGTTAVTGYTATGAASMYAWLGDAEKAYEYLDFLINHRNVSPTTMYAEGNPVIETPLSFATAIHEMLLQSWGGKIQVFRGTPRKWADVAFKDLRTRGAFLVSAKRKAGVTQFVSIKSLIGSPCLVHVDIPNPRIYIDEAVASNGEARRDEQGFYHIKLAKGGTVTFTPVPIEEADLTIAPVPVSEADCNMFGYSKKTERLPGHAFYGGRRD